MKNLCIITLAALLAAASCTGDASQDEAGGTKDPNSGASSGTSSGNATEDYGEIDPTDEEDDVAGFSAGRTITVTYSSSGATLSGDTDAVAAEVDGAGVTVTNSGEENILYVLTGSSSDGYFKLYSGHKQALKLDGLSLCNPSGAAINNQSGKRTFVVLSGESSLSDGGSYDTPEGEDEKAAFFSEGQLCFSGDGSLTVKAKGAAAITSDDYIRILGGTISATSSAGHGVRGKDAVIISEGTLSASASADTKKAVSTDGYYEQDGGTVRLTTSGAAAYDSEEGDVSGVSCIKADGDLIINGGELTASSTGRGAKAISCDGNAFFKGGSVTAATSGGTFTYGGDKTYPKAIKVDGDIVVSGGEVTVAKSSHEGIECKGTWTQDGGTVLSDATDDAIGSAGTMTVTGGVLYGHSSDNDGIDANAPIYVSGGYVIGEGTSGAETGIDSVEGTTITVDGGYVISVGGTVNSYVSNEDRGFVQTTVTRGTKIALKDGETFLLAYSVPSSGGNALLISAPGISSGSSYLLYSGVSFTPEVAGVLAIDGISGGSSSGSLTASGSVSESMGGGGGGWNQGGGGPGGGGHGGGR